MKETKDHFIGIIESLPEDVSRAILDSLRRQILLSVLAGFLDQEEADEIPLPQ
jgi:hypothetical protein